MGLVALAACGQSQPAQRAAADTASRTASSTEPGVNDRLILAAAKVALPPPGVTPADLPEPGSEGGKYVVEFCVACHNLPSPAIHSATDWPSVVRRMWLRMDRLPPEYGVRVPTPEQRQVTLDYLINNALRVSGAALPAGAGRATFSQTCSRCHALPDPLQHSPDDWGAVVTRMSTRMDQMKVDRPSPDQTQQILLYLQQVSATRRAPPRRPAK
jgi:cytochrome c5